MMNEKKEFSLYRLLFGSKDIPMTNEITFTPETKTNLIVVAAIIGFAAIATAVILKK